jgi:hypothetical protein
MLYDDTVQDTRQMFFSSWLKHGEGRPLNDLEKQIVEVILLHPEYHLLLTGEGAHASFFPELGQSNPFLHMGLHLAIRDQIATNRPLGITSTYHQLTSQCADAIVAEHLMMECLAECLWLAQKNQCLPDEAAYLAACQQKIAS